LHFGDRFSDIGNRDINHDFVLKLYEVF
jgi:hypothetical protein